MTNEVSTVSNKAKNKKSKSPKKDAEQLSPEELFAKARKEHRESTPRHVITLTPKFTEQQERHALHMSKDLSDIEHGLRVVMRKRLENLRARNDYKRLRNFYHAIKENLLEAKASKVEIQAGFDEEKEKNGGKVDKELVERLELAKLEVRVFEESLEDITDQLEELNELEGVTKDECRKIAAKLEKKSKYAMSVFALAVAEDVWSGVEKVLYGDGKRLGGCKCSHRTIRAKQADRALVIKQKNGELVISNRKGLKTFGFEIDKQDAFLVEEVDAIVDFLSDKNREKKIIENFMETGEVTEDTFRPVYAMIKPEKIRGKWRFSCMIEVEGHPKPKKKRDGTPRHDWSKKGRIGTDQGVSTYAAYGDELTEMKNLAERNANSTSKSEAKQRNLQRKMDRSRRANNPQNYNEDGTIKKGKKEWHNSKTYLRDREKYAEISRKNAASRKYAIQEDVNRMRCYGNVIITEKQSIKGLAKKAKPGKKKKDKKTGKMRYCRRKRYGRSIQHRCPGLFRAELKKKFDEYHEVDIMFRASQYDHELDAYIKKELSERTHHHQKGRASPRDMYSSFLMYCSEDEYKSADRALCIIRFEEYYTRVQEMIKDYKERGIKVLNSGF